MNRHHFTMKPDVRHSAWERWLRKPVHASRLLDDMEGEGPWSHRGVGTMRYVQERRRSGSRSLRLEFPSTSSDESGARDATLRFSADAEDWRQFNRLSVWVYPVHDGFPSPTLFMFLHNDGEVQVPDRYRRDGVNYLILRPNEWNHVVWEIENLARERVIGIDLGYHLRGRMPAWAEGGTLDFDLLRLERVEPDHYEGWSVPAGRIAFSHLGYMPNLDKTAVVAPAAEFACGDAPSAAAGHRAAAAAEGIPPAAEFAAAGTFSIIDVTDGSAAFSGEVREVRTPLGAFGLIDFSGFEATGEYRLSCGGVESEAFPVGHDVWRESLRPLLNFLYCERCGTTVAGIHGPCHGDLRCVHGERSIVVNGGWHDAGDLSQMTMHTAPIVASLFDAARTVATSDRELADRLIQEARWGLDYVVKTRFGDGYRVSTRPTGEWSDGIIGTEDDRVYEALDMPYDNFVSAVALVAAARALEGLDEHLRAQYLRMAEEDFQFAVKKVDFVDMDIAGGGGLASVELYRATGNEHYLDTAMEFARVMLTSQETETPDWDVPLSGFFYKDPRKRQILRYNPRSQMHLPIMTLVRLCRYAPQDDRCSELRECALRYADYLKRVAEFTDPFGMIPHSVYALDEVHEPGLYSSQADLHKYTHIEAEEPQYEAQVTAGIRLSDTHYLRRFPVWYGHRGNHAIVLSEAKALSAIGRLVGDREALSLAQRQLQWIYGMNPFCQSTVYGVGYDYSPLYSPTSGHMVGAMPVGVRTRANNDEPYWPPAISYNYKEVWVEPLSRYVWVVCDLLEASG